MKSISLSFKGPFRGELFKNKDTHNLPEGSWLPGVYIWGFMISGRFIPYYVGKHQTSIAGRIRTHISDITKKESTYMRLRKEYMEGFGDFEAFYKDKKFPMISTNSRKEILPKWFVDEEDHFSNRIAYLNNRKFIEKKAKLVDKMKDYPKSLLDNIDDYLSDNIYELHVMYAHCSYDSLDIRQTEFYEFIEAFTRYHLKGKTVSKSLSFDKMTKMMNGLDKIEITNVVDYGSVFKNETSMDFDGY